MNEPFFSMRNCHVASCGDPPGYTNNTPDHYHGYFENRHGEQWVFTYNYATKKGQLRGGDAGWDQTFNVLSGKVANLVFSDDEARWREACWLAVASRR